MEYVYTENQIQKALEEALELGNYIVKKIDENTYKIKHNNLSSIIENKNIVDNSIIVNNYELIELALKGLILYFKEISESDNAKEINMTRISYLNQIIDILSTQIK